jgi:GntR family transcriptional regulator
MSTHKLLLIEDLTARPLYQAVADSLVDRIRSGELKANDRIPSENDLMIEYEVGRNTVRRAIGDLVAMGVLKTIHGVGTFVQNGNYQKTAEYLLGFTREMQLQGKHVGSRVIDAQLIPADPFLARRLQIQLGAEVVFLHRVRLIEGQATALERAYLPHELCPGILESDFSAASLYQVLSEAYGRHPDHAEQEIAAKLATDEVARLLELETPAVVFVFHRETRLADGRVIEYVDSEVRADQYRFYTNLKLHSFNTDVAFRRLSSSSFLEGQNQTPGRGSPSIIQG